MSILSSMLSATGGVVILLTFHDESKLSVKSQIIVIWILFFSGIPIFHFICGLFPKERDLSMIQAEVMTFN